jgi:hypothetical protein
LLEDRLGTPEASSPEHGNFCTIIHDYFRYQYAAIRVNPLQWSVLLQFRNHWDSSSTGGDDAGMDD